MQSNTKKIGRINPDGTLDTNFIVLATNTIYCLGFQTNGQIIVGGSFTNLNGSPHNHIARLNPDGSLDTTFKPSIENYFAGDNPVFCVAVQPDGKILAGGSFFLVAGGLIKPWLIRLNSDGTLDTTFNAAPNNVVYSLTLLTDGRIFIGGAFTMVNGIKHNFIAVLNSDGTIDPTFDASANTTVFSTAIQRDGKLILGGSFGQLNDASSSFLCVGAGRFGNTKATTNTLIYDGSSITWMRGGTSPQLAWVVFDSSNDGINWTFLGKGTFNSGGWQLKGLSTTVTNCFRARGYVPCGQYNGSGWMAMDYLNYATNLPPTIMTIDGSLGFPKAPATNAFGFNIGALLGQSVVVETSTNLLDWTPATTNGIIYSPFYYSDTNLPIVSNKYYRLKLN